MARAKQPKQITQLTVGQFEVSFPNEEACDAYLVARRWPNGVKCPRCGSDRPYELKTMKFKWECPDCSPGGGGRPRLWQDARRRRDQPQGQRRDASY